MAGPYSEVILDHFRNPRNYGSLPAADIVHEGVNPLCGDRIRIELAVKGNIVEEARFKGNGCAISLAAASLLTELIVGANIDQSELISNEEILSALQSEIRPARVKCALLALEVL
ncbi:MAG: iron-sulfur cluster assembly scaffold protein, partial [Blastocatellia bacterium]|nr:iron-sulfur cluster assembly scaffold protein [Blastocatellia bacterium]